MPSSSPMALSRRANNDPAAVGTTLISSGSSATDDSPMPMWEKVLKIAIVVIMLGVIVFVIIDFTVAGQGNINGILISFLRWVRENPVEGVFAFAGVYMITTVLFIPGSILTLGAGFVFGRAVGLGLGILLGSISVLIGASLGAILSFLLGRYVLYEQAQALMNRYSVMKSVNRAIEMEGLKVMFLLRLSPVIPFTALNYVLGLTTVALRTYVITLTGITPGTVAFVFIGTSASGLLGNEDDGDEASGASDSSTGLVQILVFIIGGFFTVCAVVALSWYAKRYLNRIIAETEHLEQQQRLGERGGEGDDENHLQMNAVGSKSSRQQQQQQQQQHEIREEEEKKVDSHHHLHRFGNVQQHSVDVVVDHFDKLPVD
mmetsp:Transcript_8169/g.13190  ORF Transcript_8169/g.13190 Transcript_8169/m.13190 type:complete len:374 (+) Transcript_8169:95-1216(+)